MRISQLFILLFDISKLAGNQKGSVQIEKIPDQRNKYKVQRKECDLIKFKYRLQNRLSKKTIEAGFGGCLL